MCNPVINHSLHREHECASALERGRSFHAVCCSHTRGADVPPAFRGYQSTFLSGLLVALLLLLSASDAAAHDPKRRTLKPTKAAPQLKKARAQMDAAKAKLKEAGKYECCMKPSCDMCARTGGACQCAANVAQGKGACGECLEGWKAGLGSVKGVKAAAVTLLPASNNRPSHAGQGSHEQNDAATLLASTGKPPAPPQPIENNIIAFAELAGAQEAMISAKRTLVGEGRYACCTRGGCDSCAHGADCACGVALARTPGAPAKEKKTGKEKAGEAEGGVCGECLDGWHAGLGIFSGLTPEEVTLAPAGHAAGATMMSSQGSGTAWQPESTPVYGWRFMPGDWMVMLHGNVFVGLNNQGGPRGIGKAESQNWLMLMGSRRVGRGQLTLRGMFSAEPLTTAHGGAPQLFQTGETYRGQGLIDAQHPHDLFMELAANYTIPLSENVALEFYGGPVGEPALGPVAYMHRASAAEIPSAPLGHHWQDSTHIAHGVITGGITWGRFKLEASGFHGMEPDERRATIEPGKLDSYSFRAWIKPTANLAMQFSYGYIKNPERIHPGDLIRHSASISYNRPFNGGSWASSLIWGRNSEVHGVSNAYLAESTLNFLRKNHIYTRLELGDRQGMLSNNIFGRPGICPPEEIIFFFGQPQPTPAVTELSSQWSPFVGGDAPAGKILHPGHPGGEPSGSCPTVEQLNRWFRIGAFTFGGVRDLFTNSRVRVGIGADVTFYSKPGELDAIYGNNPISYRIFLRFRLGDMR